MAKKSARKNAATSREIGGTQSSSYSIRDHRLIKPDGTPVPFKQSPNQGGVLNAEFLIMHFTAGRNASQSIDWLTNPQAQASAHIVIARDGAVTQLVDFNRVAWHAGVSQWAGHNGLNSSSIGIELDNAGKLTRSGTGWKAWFGGSFPDSEVLEAVHKNEHSVAGWHIYTEVQLAAATAVAAAIIRDYGLQDVLGHDDIAPNRKNDPGPAFPMESFRGRVMGRQEEAPAVFETTENLNLRTAPNSSASLVTPGGLPPGTRVSPSGPRSAVWWHVRVNDAVAGANDLEGWVHSHFLTSTLSSRALGAAGRRAFGGYTPPAASASVLAGVPFDTAQPVGSNFKAIYDAADVGSSDPNNVKAILQFPNGTIFFDAKMAIDADGSPRAPQIDPTGLLETSLRYATAGHKGDSLNAEKVPYFVLPLPDKHGNDNFPATFGIKSGDLGLIVHKGGKCGVIFADLGPHRRIGEASIRAHELLPVRNPWKNPVTKDKLRNASVEGDCLYFVFPGTSADIMDELTPANAETLIQTRALECFERLKTTA